MAMDFQLKTALLLAGIVLSCGCAEGPFWRIGKYTPWAQNQWAEEERIADTQFSRKREMTQLTNAAVNAPIDERQRAAESLAEVVKRERIVLLRLHAVQLLGQLDCPAAVEALELASEDNHKDVRLAAVKAWQNMPADKAVPHLQKLLGSDTDIDVQLAATRALSNFSGPQAVHAISLALNNPDPALQLRAMESLANVTGEDLGNNVPLWQDYIAQNYPANAAPIQPYAFNQSDRRSAQKPSLQIR